MYKTITVFGIFVYMVSTVWALQITSPKEGQIFYSGDEFSVVVKPDPGEDWLGLLYGAYDMDYSFLRKEYSVKAKIPADMFGYQTLSVIGVDKLGRQVELKRNIFVKFPPNVVLKSITVSKNFMLVYKLPAGSNPDDMKKFESRQLSVYGIYSDGVKRKLTTSASGTTYTSSNEKIITVSPEGKVMAQGLGDAKITVKNGKSSSQVDIVVKPYRQPQK